MSNLVKTIAERLSTYEPDEWDGLKGQCLSWLSGKNFKGDFEQVWEDANFEVAKMFLNKNIPKTLSDLAETRIDDRRLETTAPRTGFNLLDRLIKGFIPGHLYTVTGHTNVGKTSISSNFAFNVADQGKKVLYFSLEPAETLVEYLASVKFIKPFKDITPEELKDLPDIDVFTKDQVDTIDDVLRVIRKLPHYDLIVIDHLGYFTRGNTGNVNQEQSNVVKQLVQIAKEMKTAVIQIVHVNKLTTDVPNMKNISGSAALYQDATDVLIVMRSVDESCGGVQKTYLDSGFIIVEKTKSGPTGTVPIKFMPQSAYITDGTSRMNQDEKDVYKLLC